MTQLMVLELRGYLSHGLLFLFLRYGTLDWTCNGAAKGAAQIRIFNRVQNAGCSGNIREKNIYDVLTPTSLSWGMGHMKQGH